MTTEDKDYLDSRFATFDSKFTAFDAKLDALKQYIDVRFNELRAELHQTTATTVKWCAGIVATGLLLYTTMLAFLMNNAVPRNVPATQPAAMAPAAPAVLAPPPPAAQAQAVMPNPQPIVIVIPIKP